MSNIMIDIETLGTKPGCAILSIGAVAFSQGHITGEFYEEIDVRDCQRHGLTIDADTLHWWGKQSTPIPLTGICNLPLALDSLDQFFYAVDPQVREIKVWANSPSFDLMLLNAAHDAIKRKPPWSFRQWYDLRTAKMLLLNGEPDFSPAFEGERHNALDDARYQAMQLIHLGYRG